MNFHNTKDKHKIFNTSRKKEGKERERDLEKFKRQSNRSHI